MGEPNHVKSVGIHFPEQSELVDGHRDCPCENGVFDAVSGEPDWLMAINQVPVLAGTSQTDLANPRMNSCLLANAVSFQVSNGSMSATAASIFVLLPTFG